MADAPASDTAAPRIAIVDILRGLAIVLMFVYHFAWDLTFYRLAEVPLFTSLFWLGLRAFIPGLFMALVGVSLVLATQKGLRPAAHAKRIARLAGCAAIITLATYITFPDSYIFFGVLHGIAVASVLGLAFLRVPTVILLILAALVFAGRTLFAHPLFDEPLLLWLGLVTQFPHTNDYVPIFPWFGNVLVGIAIARFALRNPLRNSRMAGSIDAWLPSPTITRPLAFLGRHGLLIYMIHQPAFLALLFPVAWLAGTVNLS